MYYLLVNLSLCSDSRKIEMASTTNTIVDIGTRTSVHTLLTQSAQLTFKYEVACQEVDAPSVICVCNYGLNFF